MIKTIDNDQDDITINSISLLARLLVILQVGLVLDYVPTKTIVNLLTSSKDLLYFRGSVHYIIITTIATNITTRNFTQYH